MHARCRLLIWCIEWMLTSLFTGMEQAELWDVCLTEDTQALLADPEFTETTETARELQLAIAKMLAVRASTLRNLVDLKHEVEKSYDKSRKARIGGTTASVVGGTMTIAGFALSFFTFGTSLALTIPGSVLSGAGGVVVGGAEVGYLVVWKTALKSAQSVCDNDRKSMLETESNGRKLASHLESLSSRHPRFSTHTVFEMVKEVLTNGKSVAKCVYCAYKVGDGIADAGRTVYNAIRIARVGQSGAQAAARTAWAGFGTAVRVWSVVGVIVDAVFIPVDIAVMVKSAYDVHKYKHGESNSAAAKEIGKLIAGLEAHKAEILELQRNLSPDSA